MSNTNPSDSDLIPEESEKSVNAYAKYSSIAIQMAVAIGGGAWLGTYLDKKFQTKTPWFTLCLSLLGVIIGVYIVLREVIKMSNKK